MVIRKHHDCANSSPNKLTKSEPERSTGKRSVADFKSKEKNSFLPYLRANEEAHVGYKSHLLSERIKPAWSTREEA